MSEINAVMYPDRGFRSFEKAATAGAVDVQETFGFEATAIIISNDSATESILVTFRQTNESVAPSTVTANRFFRIGPGEVLVKDNAHFLGIAHKQFAAASAPIRISAW
jgi:hypothetical protein